MKNLFCNRSFAVIFLLALMTSGVEAFSAETIRDGKWNDDVNWLGNHIPEENLSTTILHTIVISGTVKTGDIVVAGGGELVFSGTEGLVNLDCGTITVMPGGKVTIPSGLAGVSLTCKDLDVQKNDSEAGRFISDCTGLNMTCGSISNKGEVCIRTSNYLTVNGNMQNDSLFEYTGNGIVFHGNKLIQDNPHAVWAVTQIMYRYNNPLQAPLFICGEVHLRGTRFYTYGNVIKPMDLTSGLNFDGGYMSGVEMDSLNIGGKNRFYISSSNLHNCILNDTIECSSMVLYGKSIINGVIQPSNYGIPEAYSSVGLLISGDATLNGCLRDTLNQVLTLTYCGSFTNNGSIRLSAGISGHNCPRFVNNSFIKVKGISISNQDIFQAELKLRHPGPAIFENNGIIEANVGFDTTYIVTTQKTGQWMGEVFSRDYYSNFVGNHQFDFSNVHGFECDKAVVLSLSRSQLSDIQGQGTTVLMNQGCLLSNVQNCKVTANGPLKLLGTNSGALLTNDSLSYEGAWVGGTFFSPSFNGTLTTSKLVRPAVPELYFKLTGLWINNGTYESESPSGGLMLYGNLVNNGTYKAPTYLKGAKSQIVQNGKWEELRSVNFMLDNRSDHLFWTTKQLDYNNDFRFSAQYNAVDPLLFSKNNRPFDSNILLKFSVQDTGTYRLRPASPGNYYSKTQLVYKTPVALFNCMPKVTEASGEVTYTWNCIPGATGYKIRLISRIDGVEYAFACDSVMNGDSTLTFHKLGEQLYEAYFSVQFGYPGHYNWSQESSPVYLNLSTRPIPENPEGETRLKSGDVAIVQVNTTYNSFDFVVLKPVKAGTRIYFSDFSYSASYHDLDRSTTLDGVYTYTAPENLPAGTVIQSLNNASFSDSRLNFKSKLQNSSLNGQTLLAFQVREGADTTYLTNFAWARTNNFAPGNRFSKVSDIPPGLSYESQTVMQMDSARGGNPVQNFRYIRNEGFRGTQAQILKWLSDPGNYATYFGAINNDRVEPFTVLAEDTVVTGFSSNSRPLLMPSMRLHSNPVKERLCLTVVSPSSSLVTLQLVDVSGKVVLRRDVQLAVGLNDLELPIVGLSGYYLLRLDMNSKTLVNRVLVR